MAKYETKLTLVIDGDKFGVSFEGDPRNYDLNKLVNETIDMQLKRFKPDTKLTKICEWGHTGACDCMDSELIAK